MGSAPRAAVLLVAPAIGAAACSLGGFTGYSSGGIDPNDAGADVTTPDAIDAGNDVTSDAGQPDVDGGADSGDAAGFVCAGVFCDDFERVTLTGGWDEVKLISGGAFELDTSQARTGSRSALMTIPMGASPRAFLHENFAVVAKKAVLDFWLRAPAVARLVQLAQIALAGGGEASSFFLQMASNGDLDAIEQHFDGATNSGFVAHDISSSLETNVWQHWRLEIDTTTTPKRGRVFADDIEVGNFALTNPFAPGAVRVYLGATYALDGPTFAASYDDVSVSFTQ